MEHLLRIAKHIYVLQRVFLYSAVLPHHLQSPFSPRLAIPSIHIYSSSHNSISLHSVYLHLVHDQIMSDCEAKVILCDYFTKPNTNQRNDMNLFKRMFLKCAGCE